MRIFFLAAFLMLALLAGRSDASGFFDADQDAVRADVEYLVNSGVLHLPVSTWPLPIDDLHAAVAAAHDEGLNASKAAALQRLRNKLDSYDTDDDDSITAAGSLHPTPFRLNEALPRENGTVTLAGGRDYGRFTVHLAGSLVTVPSRASIPVDRQMLRYDGSYASAELGNWLLSAGFLPRSWGPSEHDSLILSTNARPVPAFGLDRLSSEAPSWRWLRWVGPWRLSVFLGSLEHARDDIRSPLYGGARFTFKPLHGLEIGLSRTAQFCGQGRPCNFTTFKNLFLGNTNTNTSADVTVANDPGNDMAGFDFRWVSPIGHLPYAIYGQMIGEDQEGDVPFKYLGEFGLDTWKDLSSGDAVHINIEYANTACSFTRPDPIYGCAYHHYLFNKEGYRYKGNVLGSSWQGDSEVFTVNLRWVQPSGTEWQLHARHGQLNRGGRLDVYNVAAPTQRDLNGLDVEYRFSVAWWGDFRTGLGMDRLKEPGANHTDNEPRLYVIWRHGI